MTLFSEEGKQLGSEQHAMTAPVICTGQDRLLCYDAGGNYLTVLDKSGSAVFSQTPEQTIFDADLSSGGYSAMLTSHFLPRCSSIARTARKLPPSAHSARRCPMISPS